MPTNKSFDYIVKEFSEITEIPVVEAHKIAKDFIEALKRTLKNYDGNIISLPSLGSFKIRELKERHYSLFGKTEIKTFPAKKVYKFNFLREPKKEIEVAINKKNEEE